MCLISAVSACMHARVCMCVRVRVCFSDRSTRQLERMRILARETYESNYTQMAICLILVTNFIISIVQSESLMNATEDDDKRIVRTLDFAEMVSCVRVWGGS